MAVMSTSELLARLEEAKKPKAAKIPFKAKSAADWELFTFDAENRKKSKPAASALNKAMREVAKEIGALVVTRGYDEQWWAKKLGDLYSKYMRPVMSKYSDTGATDTEPRYQVAQTMIDMVKDWYGITGFTDLGDYI